MEKHEIDILLQSTVRIECLKKNGDFAYGTGAFFPFTEPGLDGAVVTIITNRHVVKDSSRIRFYLTPIDIDGNPDLENYQPVIVEDAESLIIYHDNDDVRRPSGSFRGGRRHGRTSDREAREHGQNGTQTHRLLLR